MHKKRKRLRASMRENKVQSGVTSDRPAVCHTKACRDRLKPNVTSQNKKYGRQCEKLCVHAGSVHKIDCKCEIIHMKLYLKSKKSDKSKFVQYTYIAKFK